MTWSQSQRRSTSDSGRESRLIKVSFTYLDFSEVKHFEILGITNNAHRWILSIFISYYYIKLLIVYVYWLSPKKTAQPNSFNVVFAIIKKKFKTRYRLFTI